MGKNEINNWEEIKEYINYANKQMKDILSEYQYDESSILYNDKDYNIKIPEEKSNFYTQFNLDEIVIDKLIEIIKKSSPFTRAADKPMSTTKPVDIFKGLESSEISEAQMFTRQGHMQEVASLASFIAKGLGLNSNLAFLTGLIHDIGHTWGGHSGERILNSIANLRDCGYILHNAMIEYILTREKIIENAEQSIEQLLPDTDMNEVKKLIRVMIDGAVCHNGEGTIGKITPAFDKSYLKMQEEIMKCFTEKGADKKLLPATMEGAIIRYADIMAYSRSDIVNAFRMEKSDETGGKVFTKFDDDYLKIIGTLLAKEMGNDEFLNFETDILRKKYTLKQEIENLKNIGKDDGSGFTRDEIKVKIDEKIEQLEKIEKKYQDFEQVKIKYANIYIDYLQQKDPKQIKERIPQMMQDVFVKDLVQYSERKIIYFYVAINKNYVF